MSDSRGGAADMLALEQALDELDGALGAFDSMLFGLHEDAVVKVRDALKKRGLVVAREART
jgi:hypothetical protein